MLQVSCLLEPKLLHYLFAFDLRDVKMDWQMLKQTNVMTQTELECWQWQEEANI